MAKETNEGVGKLQQGKETFHCGRKHPRLFFTDKDLPHLRVAASKGLYQRMFALMEQEAEKKFRQMPPLEPDHGREKTDDWWDFLYHHTYNYRLSAEIRSYITLYSFLACLTEKEEYIEAAKAWVLNICDWKWWGVIHGNERDYETAWLLQAGCMAYDWLFHYLTEAERQKIYDVFAKRARKIYESVRQTPPAEVSWGPHACLVYPALGLTGVTFLGEHEETEDWVEVAKNVCLSLVERGFNQKDGSYHVSISYLGMVASMIAYFFEALKNTAGEDCFLAPFWKSCVSYALNTYSYANYGRYWEPEIAWDRTVNTLMFLIARKYKDSQAQWLATCNEAELLRPIWDFQKGYWEYGAADGVMNYVWYEPAVQPKLKAALPTAAHFPGLGLVTMRSGWDESDTFLFFKCGASRAGHEPLAQNRFEIHAGGETLAHCFRDDYKLVTEASNVVTVNGKNQSAFMKSAKTYEEFTALNTIGTISEFLATPVYTAVTGDAPKAYPDLLDKYQRRILFLCPDYFVIKDELQAQAPADFVWNLHTVGTISASGDEAVLKCEKCELFVKVLLPEKISDMIEVDDVYSIIHKYDMEARYFAGSNIWRTPEGGSGWPFYKCGRYLHQPILKVHSPEKSREATFLTVLWPRKRDGAKKESPLITRIDAEGVVGVKVQRGRGEDVILFGEGNLKAEGVTCLGTCCVCSRNTDSALTRYAIHNGTSLRVEEQELFFAEAQATAAFGIDLKKLQGQVQLPAAAVVKLHLLWKPEVVLIDGNIESLIEYDVSDKMATLSVPSGEHQIVMQK